MRGESRKKDTTGRGKRKRMEEGDAGGGGSLESNKIQGLTMCLKEERLKGPQEDFPAPESWPREDLLLVAGGLGHRLQSITIFYPCL